MLEKKYQEYIRISAKKNKGKCLLKLAKCSQWIIDLQLFMECCYLLSALQILFSNPFTNKYYLYFVYIIVYLS